jgi:fluoride ion exporter CrcB/FEX
MRAAANIVGSVVFCLVGVWLGHTLAVAISH